MTEFADLILRSGRAAVEFALFILLPIMIVMLTIMRLLEAKGVLDRIVARLSPLLHPLGIPGLGVFALLQVLFVSFAAPVATLTMMDKGGLSQRHIAATLALVFAAAQGKTKYEFIVRPGGDPSQIRLRYDGAISMRHAAFVILCFE